MQTSPIPLDAAVQHRWTGLPADSKVPQCIEVACDADEAPVLTALGFRKKRRARASLSSKLPEPAALEQQQENARQLAAIVSMLKYTNKQSGGGGVPLASNDVQETPNPIEQQAAAVRNKLELHAQVIELYWKLMLDSTHPDIDRCFRYNPLQTIRDRAARRYRSDSSFLWDVSLHEEILDFTWRHRVATRIHHGRHHMSRLPSPPSLLDENSPEDASAYANSKSQHGTHRSSTRLQQTSTHAQSQMSSLAPSLFPMGKRHKREPSDSLLHMPTEAAVGPANDCQLIERLRSKHYTDTSSDEVGAEASLAMMLQQPPPLEKPMFRHSAGAGAAVAAGDKSMKRRSSVCYADLKLHPNKDTSLCSPVSLRVDNCGTIPIGAPQLVVTGVDNAVEEFPGDSDPISSDDDEDDDDKSLANFGSVSTQMLIPSTKPRLRLLPQHELEKMILLYERTLHFKNLTTAKGTMQLCIPLDPCVDECCDVENMKNNIVPRFVQCLTNIECQIRQQHSELESELTTLDSLRIASDNMVLEVNNTLNKQLREANALLARLSRCKRSSQMAFNVFYCSLEYAVHVMLWCIWAFVTTFRLLKFALLWLLNFLRSLLYM